MKTIKKAIGLSLALFVICGFMFPMLMTGISQLLFPYQANGSLLSEDGQVVASELIGQDFSDPRFMKGRPSAVNYNTYREEELITGEYEGVATGSDNYANSNPELLDRVELAMEAFLLTHPDVASEDIPAELLTASGSGLDPHITVESAYIQIPELAKQTGLSEETLKQMVDHNTSEPLFSIFGTTTVNVVKVNIEIAKAIGLIQ